MKQNISDNQIIIDELGMGLYKVHHERKNYRINRVLRTLVLRKDFIGFIDELENTGLKEYVGNSIDDKSFKIWGIYFEQSKKLIDAYLKKIEKSFYYSKQNQSWKDNFFYIAENIIESSYLDGCANRRNKNSFFQNITLFDDGINYPNISEKVFDKNIFWEVFNDAFYKKSKEIVNKYGKHPANIVIGSKFIEIPSHPEYKPTDPKICQIVFDDTTEKQELIDYIDKKWPSIEDSLKGQRPQREEKRITNPANFLRDITIYNKYQEFKNAGLKNPDIKTWTWLKDESEYKIQVEPNTITKIVSSLKLDIKEINMEK